MSSQVFTKKSAYYAGVKDGDFEYLGLEVGRGGGILGNRTFCPPLSTRQTSSGPNVGQVSDRIFTPNN